ncbi:MAG: hypothetical protein KatS3mg077_3187 [Candidatus Binatia bacterium]|nr:MAG: hypothetical protein KatS3mg077_3187 [Candidatus Binatia bacterium]
MLTTEQLRAIRKIQIHTNHLVSDFFAGAYHSVFKGRGIEFAEVRPYIVGDDVRTIDWNVTARTGTPHVKRFVEERELAVMLVVDVSASTRFGSVRQLKSELAAELAALFAFSAIRNNDKVGLILFSERIEHSLRPKKGTRHVLRVVRDVLSFVPHGRGTNLAAAMEHLVHVHKRRAVVFVLSDFLDAGGFAALKLARQRHDVIAIVLDDPRDFELPPVGLVRLADPETGRTLVVDTSHPEVRRRFAESAASFAAERLRRLKSCDIDTIVVPTDRPYVPALVRFFRTREKRR